MAKSAIIFPGQGSHVVSMGKDLVEISDHATSVFNQANEILGFDLANLCFEGPAEKLEATDIQQPAILVTSVAYWRALTRGGQEVLDFYATAGLSLGEYTALHIAGSLSFEDAVRLVHQRGRFMQEASTAQPSGMVSVMGMEPDEVQSLCQEASQGQVLQPSNFNCPGQIVISGDRSACERAANLVEQRGTGKAIILKVAGAFHSALMEPAADKLKSELVCTAFSQPRVPVISNVDAQPHGNEQTIRDALYRQVISPVLWQASIEHLIDQGVDTFVEVGPGRSLTGMMRKIDRKKTAVNISSAGSLEKYKDL